MERSVNPRLEIPIFFISKVLYGFTPQISPKWRSLSKNPFEQMAVTPQMAEVWESKLLVELFFLSRIFSSAPLPHHGWHYHLPQSPKLGNCPNLHIPHSSLVSPKAWAYVSLSLLHPPLYQGGKLGKDKQLHLESASQGGALIPDWKSDEKPFPLWQWWVHISVDLRLR